ncbi:MAG: pyrroline-5-carboxylate reductase [Alteromonadaceae bacterium]|nr:pyrroline-5-carboxylate reductase [Alteromonadaceae bacterium]
MKKIAFIGAGNMNSSIIGGLIKQGWSPENIIVSNPSPEKRLKLAQLYGIKETASNIEAAEFADFIVLGVKPHFIDNVCEELSNIANINEKCFISIAAGCTISQIQSALAGKYPVIRTMPNTPSQLGLGMTGMFASTPVSKQQLTLAEKMMSAVGKILWLQEEQQINFITSISGSGPAYFFLFMEALEQKAKDFGFSDQASRMLVQQTAFGAASMVVENSNLEISQLRTNVTSKGGTTQAALNKLTESGFPQLVTDAVDAALQRTIEMAQNNG